MIDREQIENWDRESIADLCKPISAKKMPRSSLWGHDNMPLTDEEAISIQRQSGKNKHADRRKRPCQ